MREKVEQESKLGDFEIQSIKLLAFRRAVAGVVHQPAPSLPPPPSSPPPPRARPPTSLVHSLLRPFFRVVLFPFLPLSNRGEAPPLKCIPMYHRPTTFAHSTLEICTCAHLHRPLPLPAPLFAATSTSSPTSSSSLSPFLLRLLPPLRGLPLPFPRTRRDAPVEQDAHTRSHATPPSATPPPSISVDRGGG